MINDKDEVAVLGAQGHEQEGFVRYEIRPEGIGGVGRNDHRHDWGDEQCEVAASRVGGGRFCFG